MKAYLQSDEYKRAVAEAARNMTADSAVVEHARWFGTTGLSIDSERELPRYLRREFGESLSDADALKADDLTYVGAFSEGNDLVHYWQVPAKDPTYAYIAVGDASESFGWGNRTPPVPAK
jgi:hypothetical protein